MNIKTILHEDFEYIYEQHLPWDDLKGCSVLVTGGTGLIGSLLIKYMDYLNREKEGKIRLVTICRNLKKAEEILAGINVDIVEMNIAENIWQNQENLSEKYNIPEKIDYVFHCAAVTKSKEMVEYPVEVFESIVNGTNQILKMARNRCTRSMVYLSSMEVYGQPENEQENMHEGVYGFINPLDCRSCYSMGKRMAENVCYDYYTEYSVPVKIARLAQTFGAGVLPGENRVFAQFARSAELGNDIVLHTDGSSVGNYCYTADALFGLFVLLFKGKDGEAYNIANENNNMSIKQMAELVAETIAEKKINIVFDIPESNSYGYAPPVKMKLCSDKIRGLGWNARYDMVEMYRRMMKG